MRGPRSRRATDRAGTQPSGGIANHAQREQGGLSPRGPGRPARGRDAATAQTVKPVGTIDVSGQKLALFDRGIVAGGTVCLSDRSNKAVDRIDARSRASKGRVEGFAVLSGSNDTARCNGVTVAPQPAQVWDGDGDGSVKVIDLGTKAIVATVPTGGRARVDGMAVDAAGSTVPAASDADDPALASLISTQPDHRVLARIEFPGAGNGIEQPLWDAETEIFYIAVPEIGEDRAKGEIAVIDPKAGKVVRTAPFDRCQPAGLVAGPAGTVLAGCSEDAVEAGFPLKSLLVDVAGGRVGKTFDEVGGSDEVAFDPAGNLDDLAAQCWARLTRPARSGSPTCRSPENTRPVAVDPATGQVFVPKTLSADCSNGCVAVFGPAS